MAIYDAALNRALQSADKTDVFCFVSSEHSLLQDAAQKTLSALKKQLQDDEVTTIEGPSPSIEDAVAAAGTISMFGTRRLVYMPDVAPYSMTEGDAEELAGLLQALENAVVVLTIPISDVFAEMKAQTGSKKMAAVLNAAKKVGYFAQLEKPRAADMQKEVLHMAQESGAKIAPPVAAELVQRVGVDLLALQNEVDKLAAVCGYTEITQDTVRRMGTVNLDADVFEITQRIVAGDEKRMLLLVRRLLDMQENVIGIAAVISGGYVDMLRARFAKQAGRSNDTAAKEMRYKGNGGGRLARAGTTAAPYSTAQLAQCVQILTQLDKDLKSSAVDNEVLLQTALTRMCHVRKR